MIYPWAALPAGDNVLRTMPLLLSTPDPTPASLLNAVIEMSLRRQGGAFVWILLASRFLARIPLRDSGAVKTTFRCEGGPIGAFVVKCEG